MSIEDLSKAIKEHAAVMRRVQKTLAQKERAMRWSEAQRLKQFDGKLGEFIDVAEKPYPNKRREDGGVAFKIRGNKELKDMGGLIKSYLRFRAKECFYAVDAYTEGDKSVLTIGVHSDYSRQRYIRVVSKRSIFKTPKLNVEFGSDAGSPMPEDVKQVKLALDESMAQGVGQTVPLMYADQILSFAIRGGIETLRRDIPKLKGSG